MFYVFLSCRGDEGINLGKDLFELSAINHLVLDEFMRTK